MRSWLIRQLGLKGSFAWAVRQMAKGEIVTRHSVTSTMRYKLPNIGFTPDLVAPILSTFDNQFSTGHYNWQCAKFNATDVQALDWCLMTEHKPLMDKLLCDVTSQD